MPLCLGVLGVLVGDMLNAPVVEVPLKQVPVLVVDGHVIVAVVPPEGAVPALHLKEGLDVVPVPRNLDHRHLGVPGEAINDAYDMVPRALALGVGVGPVLALVMTPRAPSSYTP